MPKIEIAAAQTGEKNALIPKIEIGGVASTDDMDSNAENRNSSSPGAEQQRNSKSEE